MGIARWGHGVPRGAAGCLGDVGCAWGAQGNAQGGPALGRSRVVAGGRWRC